MKTIIRILSRLLSPSYDQLINRANREMHTFHLLKYKDFPAANAHRQRAYELYRAADHMKRGF